MKELNIPLYRAKKMNSDEYVIGLIVSEVYNMPMTIKEDLIDIKDKKGYEFICDYSTLSISFPDMLDSQANKIFASLSESGKGGDILNIKEPYRRS